MDMMTELKEAAPNLADLIWYDKDNGTRTPDLFSCAMLSSSRLLVVSPVCRSISGRNAAWGPRQ